MLDSERICKGKVALDSFRNFAYDSSYLDLKSFAWKSDYPTSSKLKNDSFFKKFLTKALLK